MHLVWIQNISAKLCRLIRSMLSRKRRMVCLSSILDLVLLCSSIVWIASRIHVRSQNWGTTTHSASISNSYIKISPLFHVFNATVLAYNRKNMLCNVCTQFRFNTYCVVRQRCSVIYLLHVT